MKHQQVGYMEERKLGNGDLLITPIGARSGVMGGDGRAFAWGPDDQHFAAIHEAWSEVL